MWPVYRRIKSVRYFLRTILALQNKGDPCSHFGSTTDKKAENTGLKQDERSQKIFIILTVHTRFNACISKHAFHLDQLWNLYIAQTNRIKIGNVSDTCPLKSSPLSGRQAGVQTLRFTGSFNFTRAMSFSNVVALKSRCGMIQKESS